MPNFLSRITPVGRVLLAGCAVGVLWGAKYVAFDCGKVFTRSTSKSMAVGAQVQQKISNFGWL
jgi:hypothetical protein